MEDWNGFASQSHSSDSVSGRFWILFAVTRLLAVTVFFQVFAHGWTWCELRACGVHPVSVARFSHESHPKHSEAHSAREQGSAFPVEAQPRYKIRLQLTRHPRTYRVSRSFSLQEICSREDRRFLFSLQQPETDVDGQALWHFDLLYFGSIISSAGGVLSRVLLDFFSLS